MSKCNERKRGADCGTLIGLVAVLLLCFFWPPAACAADIRLRMAMNEAKALAAKGCYEQAIGLLENTASTVIGDPDSLAARDLTRACYHQWFDAAKRQHASFAQAKVLTRILLNQPALAREFDANQQLPDILNAWQADCAKSGNYTDLLAVCLDLSTLPDQDLAAYHRKILGQQIIVLAAAKPPATKNLLPPALAYVLRYKYDLTDIPADTRATVALALVKEAQGCTQHESLEYGIRLCAAAPQWVADKLPETFPATRGRLLLALGQWYQDLADLDRAAAWYKQAADAGDAKSKTDADALLQRLQVLQDQSTKLAHLPDRLGGNAIVNDRKPVISISKLPVPYFIQSTVEIDNAKITVAPGVRITGGVIYFKGGELNCVGTPQAPVVLDGVTFYNANSDKLSSLLVTGKAVIFLHCKTQHDGTYWTRNQQVSLDNSYVINVMDRSISFFKEFHFAHCTLRDSQFHMADVVYPGLEDLLLDNCQLNGPMLCAMQRANLLRCRYEDHNGDWNGELLPLNQPLVQAGLWFDQPSTAILESWPARARYALGSKAGLVLLPTAKPNPNCGANWPCPSFKAYEELIADVE